ncbi:MAG: VOC family protein [Rhodothermales bacterium]
MNDSTCCVALDHAAIVTQALQPALDFYVELLGLTLSVVEPDPIREGRQRALLTDANGRTVLELIEIPEYVHASVPGHGAMHHLGFRFPERAWHAFRSRLDTQSYPYHQLDLRLFVRDADGLMLEIEHA